MQSVSKSLSPRLVRISKTHLPIQIPRAVLSQATGAGDPKVHSGDPPGEAPSDDYPEMPAKFSAAEKAQEQGTDHISKHSITESMPVTGDPKEKVPPFAPSGKLESHEVMRDSGAAMFQQKRRFSGSAKRDPHEVEDDRTYYKNHKPSPLSHIGIADTRKPYGKATDGPASASEVEGGEGRGVMLDDTVDAALERAERLFREAATRGVPEWPHSWALRRMLRMREQEGGDATTGLA